MAVRFVRYDLPTRNLWWACWRSRFLWSCVAIESQIMRSNTLHKMNVKLIGRELLSSVFCLLWKWVTRAFCQSSGMLPVSKKLLNMSVSGAAKWRRGVGGSGRVRLNQWICADEYSRNSFNYDMMVLHSSGGSRLERNRGGLIVRSMLQMAEWCGKMRDLHAQCAPVTYHCSYERSIWRRHRFFCPSCELQWFDGTWLFFVS